MVLALATRKVEELDIPDVLIGGKSWCIDRMGLLLLQRGPGVLRCICCTHVGSAYFNLYDATPEDFAHQRARRLFPMCPTILGCWMLDAGFNKGLIIELTSAMVSSTIPPSGTIVWAPYKDRPRA